MKHRLEKSLSPSKEQSVTTVEHTEQLLAGWFGRPVVLTSSGRSAITLALEGYGLSRHHARLSLPRYMSQCVMDAVTRYAFPIDCASGVMADATFFYHQYGFPQTTRPAGRVLEDIANAFFASKETGARVWAGDIAIFSLPKFLPISSMVGGIVVSDEKFAARLRERRDSAPIKKNEEIIAEAKIFQKYYQTGGPGLEQMFLARLLNPRIFDKELGGVPTTLEEIKAIGVKRRAVLDTLLEAAGVASIPLGWSDMLHTSLPYAFPVAGILERLMRLDAAFKSAGIASDIYHIDINRNQFSPNYQKMLLIPYSHLIPDDLLAEIVRIVRAG